METKSETTEVAGNLSTEEMTEMFWDDIKTDPQPDVMHTEKSAPVENAPDDSGQDSKDDDKSEGSEESGESEESEESEESGDAEDSSEEKPKASKKVKVGEDEIDLALDAVVPHKVDGKDVNVTIEDLLKNYAGKVAWEQRFADLGREKATFSKDKAKISKLASKFYEKANSKDPLGAIAVVAEASGVDPVVFMKQFRGNIFKMVRDYKDTDDNELRRIELEENEKTYESTLAERQKEQKYAAETAQISDQTEKIIAETGATREEFITIYEELVQQGKIDPNEKDLQTNLQNLEQLGQTYLARQREDKVIGILHSVDPNLDNEKFKKVGVYLYEQSRINPELSDSDLKEIAQTLLSDKGTSDQADKKRRLTQKLKKTAPEKLVKKDSKLASGGPMFFEDL